MKNSIRRYRLLVVLLLFYISVGGFSHSGYAFGQGLCFDVGVPSLLFDGRLDFGGAQGSGVSVGSGVFGGGVFESDCGLNLGDLNFDSDFSWSNASSGAALAVASEETKQDGSPKPKLSFAEKNIGAFRSRKKCLKRSPSMAALCSAVIPGLGQCYNAQWYKPPVIYAGGAVLGYFIATNYKDKRVYEKEIKLRHEGVTEGLNPDLEGYSKSELLDLRNSYQQNFELSIILTGVLYLLNIVDAVVYAHLSDFNVSSNLSMRVSPYKNARDTGLSLYLTLK